MIDPAVGALLAGAFALLFASAALHKLLDPQHFAAAFSAYELVPASLGFLSRLVPLLELAVALALLAARWRSSAAVVGGALLLVYAAAIAVNLRRGRADLDCGCAGPAARRPIRTWMVWRNILLAALLAALLLPRAPRPLTAADALTIGAGITVVALLYLSLDTLLVRSLPFARLRAGSQA